MQRLRPAKHSGKRLDGRANDIDQRLLSGQRNPRGLGVEAHQHRARVAGTVGVAQLGRPDPAGRTVFRDLLEEVDVGVEEKRQPRSEIVDIQATGDRLIDVGESVLERKGKLLDGCRTGLADVVARDRDRVPARHVVRAPLDHVAHQPHSGIDRETPLLLCDVLLQDVGLDGAAKLVGSDSLTLGRDHVEREHDRRRSVDRHRHRDLTQRDVGKQPLHVGGCVDRDALTPDLTETARMVGVVAHQAGHIERGREPGLTVLEQVPKPLVGLFRCAETGELTHRPELPAVHGGVHAAGEREHARRADRLLRRQISRRVQGLERLPRERFDRRVLAFHWLQPTSTTLGRELGLQGEH